jgi:tetratricopeptide (TPR) repeat protein
MFRRTIDHAGTRKSPRSSRQVFLLLLASLAVQFAQAASVRAQTDKEQQNTSEVTTLEVDKPIERELRGGEKHAYPISLSEGQCIKLEVRSKGIDLGLDLQLPDGKLIQWFQPFGGQPEMSMTWVAESTGIYRPIIYASAKAPAGRYEIQLLELRPATENDRALQQARDLFTEYSRLIRLARFAEARAPLMRALEIRERILGVADLLVAETLVFLAANYSSTGEYAPAEPLYVRAQRIFEQRLGPDHPRVARLFTDLGGFYLQKGDELKAEESDRRALGIYERAHLAENPAVGSILATLGGFFYARV